MFSKIISRLPSARFLRFSSNFGKMEASVYDQVVKLYYSYISNLLIAVFNSTLIAHERWDCCDKRFLQSGRGF